MTKHKNYKSVIVNVNLEIPTPFTTEKEAEDYARHYELPSEYLGDSFDIVKIVDNDEKYYCPKCGKELTNNISNSDYFMACEQCDEDFYFSEVDTYPRFIPNGQISQLQRKMLKEKCPACGEGKLNPIGEGDDDQEVCLWCDTCDCSVDTDGGCIS